MNVVCFSCFAPNVRTFNIKDTHLKNVYEKILDLKVHTDTPLCYLCYKRLQQCEQLVKLVQGPKNDNETTEDPFCTTNLQYSVPSHKPITVKNEIKEECFHEDMVYDPVTKTIAGEDPLMASINCDSESDADEPKEDSSKFKLEIESLGTRRRCTFKRMLILDTWLTVKKSASDSDRGRQVMRILTRTLPKYIGKDNIDNLEHRIFSLCKRLARFWTKSQENRAIMVANNSDWLNTTEICRIAGLFPLVNVPKKPPKESPIRKDFKEVCEDSQRRRLNKLAQVDKTAYQHLKALADANSSNIKFTSNEISVFLNESKLTRRQYSLMRELINAKSPKALPCYQNVLAVRKQSSIIIESDDSE